MRFAIKTASILVIKNRPMLDEKSTAPGASALKTKSWPQPDRTETQNPKLLLEQIF